MEHWKQIIEHAKEFAIKNHEGQVHGPRPFWHHLRDVVGVLKEFDIEDPYLLAAAWLHDVVEDTPVTVDEITAAFGDRIGALVDALTDGEGETREEKKAKPYRMLPTVEGGIIVKLADRIANVRFSKTQDAHEYLSCYRIEYEGFRKALWSPGKHKEMWYHLDCLLTGGMRGL